MLKIEPTESPEVGTLIVIKLSLASDKLSSSGTDGYKITINSTEVGDISACKSCSRDIQIFQGSCERCTPSGGNYTFELTYLKASYNETVKISVSDSTKPDIIYIGFISFKTKKAESTIIANGKTSLSGTLDITYKLSDIGSNLLFIRSIIPSGAISCTGDRCNQITHEIENDGILIGLPDRQELQFTLENIQLDRKSVV